MTAAADLATDLRDAAKDMTQRALEASQRAPHSEEGFASQDAKNFAGAALALTQAYCTVVKAANGR